MKIKNQEKYLHMYLLLELFIFVQPFEVYFMTQSL